MSLRQEPVASRPGRVIGRDEALALANKILEWVPDPNAGVFIEHNARIVMSVENGAFSEWHGGDELSIWFRSEFGEAWPVWIATNQLTPESLAGVFERARELQPPPLEVPPKVNPDDPTYFTVNPQEFIPVSLWHTSTADVLDAPAESPAPQLLSTPSRYDLQSDDKLIGSLVSSTRSTLYIYGAGLTAWSQETDTELAWRAYTSDGRVSAWSGAAHRNIDALQSGPLSQRTTDILQRSREPVGVEPGRRVAILGPAAVAQLVRFMADSFEGGRITSPFKVIDESGRRKSRIGQQVFDKRIRMVSDPADPEGGFPPFFEFGTPGLGKIVGLPIPAMTWVDGGVLQQLAWGIKDYGRPWCEVPYSVRLEAMPGTVLTTVDEMIANCEEGVYINRLSGLQVIHSASGTMTGVTRDGCFLVRKGKITKAVKNFRFVESPFHLFNRLLAIGATERVALGMQDPTPSELSAGSQWPPQGRWTRWPRVPIIVPPMMFSDFNFSALAEAV